MAQWNRWHLGVNRRDQVHVSMEVSAFLQSGSALAYEGKILKHCYVVSTVRHCTVPLEPPLQQLLLQHLPQHR